MATLQQVEEAIFQTEGFRVKLVPFEGVKGPLPAYDHTYMAPNKWKLSEWQSVRLAPYVPYIRSIEVLRGDEQRAKPDVRLGNLRDTYFAQFCSDEEERRLQL